MIHHCKGVSVLVMQSAVVFLCLQNLAYSPNTPVGDAAKLYWHFYRTNQSGAAGVIITLLLYTVLSLLSSTILLLYLLR